MTDREHLDDAELERVMKRMRIEPSEAFKEKSFQSTLEGIRMSRQRVKRKKTMKKVMGIGGSVVLLAAAILLTFQLTGYPSAWFGAEEQDEPREEDVVEVENEEPVIDEGEPGVVEPGQDEAEGNEPDAEAPAQVNRPETKRDAFFPEGIREEGDFYLVNVPGLGFSTYVIEDLEADTLSSGEGTSLIVTANFAGTLNENARMTVFTLPEDQRVTVDEMLDLAEEHIATQGFELRDREQGWPNRFDIPGVDDATEFDVMKTENGTHIFGTVSVFEQNDRVYRLFVHYPEEFEEGFVPRIVKALEDIEWY